VHSNSSECLERADVAAHCCYSCLDCPAVDPTRFIPRSRVDHHQCAPNLCNAVYDACIETDHPEKKCQEVANDASHCCEECGTCNAGSKVTKAIEREHNCHSRFCNAVVDVCTHVHSNTTGCQERGDVAANCCYNCVDCPSNAQPIQPKRAHCQPDLCQDVFQTCMKYTDRHPDECRMAADQASDCCEMCGRCR
jgi:hypothetical protein